MDCFWVNLKNVGPPFLKFISVYIKTIIYTAGKSFSAVMWPWFCKWKTLALPIWRLELIIKLSKFLGIIIDQHLTWKNHIEYAIKKIIRTSGLLCRIRFYIDQSLVMWYNSLIYPYISPNQLWQILHEKQDNWSLE